MKFLDINTNYSPRGGGVRTYHQSKVEWFEKNPQHDYVLVCPGPRSQARQLAPNVLLQSVYGFQLTRDPCGYRLLLDYAKVTSLIRQLKPQVVEVGDPWLTSVYSVVFKRLGVIGGVLSSFYHSDTTRAYLQPWANSGRLQALKRLVVPVANAWLLAVQRRFAYTLTSSSGVREHLVSQRVKVADHMPFGAPADFLAAYRPLQIDQTQPIKLLYFGRLEVEKGADLLLDALPEILRQPDFEVSIMGRGSLARRFQQVDHPRFRFLGFRESRQDVLSVLQQHHVILAPGPYETFGLAALEAMALGLPVIGPDQGGIGELLGDVPQALIFRAGDRRDFLRTLVRSRTEDLKAHSQRHREVALKYGSWDDAIGRMVQFYVDQCKNEAAGVTA